MGECVCVCEMPVYGNMYACVCINMHVWMNTHVCVYARACIVHLRYVSICVCMYFCVRVYMNIHVCEYEYIALGKKVCLVSE